MQQIDVLLPTPQPKQYPILIGTELLTNPLKWLPTSHQRLVIVTDHTVKKYYGQHLANQLKQMGLQVLLLSFRPGESSKSSRTKCRLEEKMLAEGYGRDTLLLALGGGVVGDLTGFIAATYMRGIPYLHIPTSLLAMLDSSVGGKTGIDTPLGKNLIGAFWQPHAVVADVGCLKTLPKLHLINGLVEAIKIFLTCDATHFQHLKQSLPLILNHDETSLLSIIKPAVALKADIVEKDEREQHVRAVLNFGHTIGHALEALSNYQLLHGYAVGLGILVEAKISQLLGHLSAIDYKIIQALLNQLNIHPSDLISFDVNAVIQATLQDKKRKSGIAHYVLISGLGMVYEVENQFSHPVTDHDVRAAFSQVIKEVEHGRK